MNIQEQLETAENLIVSGDYTAAQSMYNEIITAEPECVEAWLILGSIHGELGEIDKATEHVEKAITISPDNGNAHLILGQIKNSGGDYSAASSAFEKAVQCAPEDTTILCTRAAFLKQQGELSEAIKFYEKAVELDDTLVDVWAMLGPLHFQDNNLSASETCYQKALSFQMTNPTTFIGYCSLLNATGKSSEALELINNLPESEKSNPEVLFLLASSYVAEGQNAEAIEYIDKAISQDPQERFILNKADLLQTMSNYEQAFEILKPYLESKPPNVSAVLTLSKFCKSVDLENECVQLLDTLLTDEGLTPYVKQHVQDALAFLKG